MYRQVHCREVTFQSTLPRGSDLSYTKSRKKSTYFNPRSLAGATPLPGDVPVVPTISIHAPSRERPALRKTAFCRPTISIHAPSRERHRAASDLCRAQAFQSTLPRGSDAPGLTLSNAPGVISIHAPSRERRQATLSCSGRLHFNPRSLAGATCVVLCQDLVQVKMRFSSS